VLDLAGRAIEYEEAGGVANRERGLRDLARWQIEVEIEGLQKSFFWGRPPSAFIRPK